MVEEMTNHTLSHRCLSNPVYFKKEPYIFSKEPCEFWKEPRIFWKETSKSVKMSDGWRNDDHTLLHRWRVILHPQKEPCVFSKEPMNSEKSPIHSEKRHPRVQRKCLMAKWINHTFDADGWRINHVTSSHRCTSNQDAKGLYDAGATYVVQVCVCVCVCVCVSVWVLVCVCVHVCG